MPHSQLLKRQHELKLNLIDFDLSLAWFSHQLIADLRDRIFKYFPEGLYDPQDLEHQTLFRLTTYDPQDITEEIIKDTVEEQFLIISERLKQANGDLPYLFRGLSGKYQSLNVNQRLTLEWLPDGGGLVARDLHHSIGVEFKKITDTHIIDLFTSDLHYMHHERSRGDTFGLFYYGEDVPWAIETTEPVILGKEYKRNALLAYGFDPNKAIELTRFYTLPGAPRNAISVMDRLVGDYYRKLEIEVLITTTMPMYSKTKGATIAGGLNKVLLVKDLVHKFVPVIIQGRKCWQLTTSAYIETEKPSEVLMTHPNFPTLHTVEVYMPLSTRTMDSLPSLQDGHKVPYVSNRPYIQERKKVVEVEVKFHVTDIGMMLEKIRKHAKYSHTEYLRDTILGAPGKKKIRLRVADCFVGQKVVAIYKYKIDGEDGVKTEVEELVYSGQHIDEAHQAIQSKGDFKKENSYEKMRVVYLQGGVCITLDIYPFGVWIEIEGSSEEIWKFADLIGYSKADAITENADELYLKWNTQMKLTELWDVRYGLPPDGTRE